MLNVLIVDDASEIRTVAKAWLSTTHTVTTCEDIQTALHAVQRVQPDVAIVDLNLGTESGLACYAKLREVSELSGCRYYLMSAMELPALNRMTKTYGLHGAIDKPLTRAKLLDCIEAQVATLPGAQAAPIVDTRYVDRPTAMLPLVISDLEIAALDAWEEYRQRNLHALMRLGHRLAGTCATFGLNTLAPLGRELEHAARSADYTAIVTALGVLCLNLREVKRDLAIGGRFS